MAPLGVGQLALVLQKRRRWRDKDAQGAQGAQGGSVSGVGARFAMLRPWSDLAGQEALEGLDASGVGHDSLRDIVESVTCPMSVAMSNLAPWASQNENC